MRGASEQFDRSAERRKLARSQAIRDLAADWQRWTRAERLTAGAVLTALWLTLTAFYLTKIFHG
jgi:hypothetical protein